MGERLAGGDDAGLHHMGKALVIRDLPGDIHGRVLGGGCEGEGIGRARRGIGKDQPRPQHHALGRRRAGGHAQRERVGVELRCPDRTQQRPHGRRG
ncbi:hypothetical protein D3C87_1757770 [compost metagenome]